MSGGGGVPCEQDHLMAHLHVTHRARYVLDVIEAQHIGNTSEAWHVGVDRLREAVEQAEANSRVHYSRRAS